MRMTRFIAVRLPENIHRELAFPRISDVLELKGREAREKSRELTKTCSDKFPCPGTVPRVLLLDVELVPWYGVQIFARVLWVAWWPNGQCAGLRI